MANSSSGESLISRAVRVLGALSDQKTKGKNVRETARLAGLPVSTTHRILSELEVEGLVSRDPAGGGWRHGTRLWEMVRKGAPLEGLREASVPAMEDLVASFEVHVSLGVLDRNEVLYIERFAPHELTKNISAVAGRLAVHATSAGLALMASASVSEQALLLSRNLEKFTASTSTNPNELRRHLAQIRRDGFCVSAGTVIQESTGISVPIFGGAGNAIAALSVIVPIEEENVERYVPHLKFASKAIQRHLGIEPNRGVEFARRTTSAPAYP
ncbi:IclR family transcriptional regulator [Yaniella flava]|uniref:IclR family transcriptional regulator n=1 Tax=Yaniella flava TaxID=287930 RepID=A0ABP5FVS7_9MICC